MTDWQSLISDAFVREFLARGRMLSFRLARADLAALAGQVTQRDPAELLRDWWATVGVVGVRCLVHCEPLGKAIVVDEWVKSPALAMAQAARRVNVQLAHADQEDG